MPIPKTAAWALVTSFFLNLNACRSNASVSVPVKKPEQIHLATPAPPESPVEKSCRVFVQKFYDWQVAQNIGLFCSNSLKGTAATQESIDQQDAECKVASTYRNAERLRDDQVLGPKLRHYLKLEGDQQAKDEDPGLDFDPFLNSQDPSPKFVVDSVRVYGDRCDAVVHGYDLGQKREEVMPEVSKASGRWIIVNFHYRFDLDDGKGPFDDDLIHMLRQYLGEVK
jgi:hypothetical protein